MPRPKKNQHPKFEFASLSGEAWEIAELKLFQRFTNLSDEAHIPAWLAWVSGGKRNWPLQVIRMLCGLNPATKPANFDADYSHVWTLADTAKRFSKTEQEITSTIEALEMDWCDFLKDNPVEPDRDTVEPEPEVRPALPPSEVSDAEFAECCETAAQFGFHRDMIDLMHRSSNANRLEARWLASRVKELEKVFLDPNAKSVVRQAVINEMFIRRIDDAMAQTPILDKAFWAYQESKQAMEQIYARQWDQLREICPEIRAKEAKLNFAGVFSEIIEAVRKYRAEGNNEIVDGMFTALEIQVLMRSSQQAEGRVQYRPDIVACVNEARRALWDPKFSSRLDPRTLSLFAAGFHRGVAEFTLATGLALPDLESKAGEYPMLFVPPPEVTAQQIIDENRELVLPEHAVPLQD